MGHGSGHGHSGHHDGHHRAGLIPRIRSVFVPHRHHAADSIDHAFKASNDGIRAVKISLVALAVTAGTQAVMYLMRASSAITTRSRHKAIPLPPPPPPHALALGR